MWWLGSLPWAYCPTSPVMSACSRPTVAEGAEKRPSSSVSNRFNPARRSPLPSWAVHPAKSCTGAKEYCQALASVKWLFTSRGSKGVNQPPLVRGRTSPVSGSSMERYPVARRSYSARKSGRPAASAKRAMHQSS